MALSITILEVSGNVVVTASGSINLSGLTFVALTGGGSAFVNPSGAVIVSSAVGFDMDSYNGNSTILNLGSGGFTSASSYSGNDFGIAAAGNEIYVRQGYVSNTPINGTITFNGTNFTTMGFTQGTYTSSWASDSVTIQVGLPPSPTPTNTQTPTVTPTNTPTPTSTPQPNSIEITSVNYVGQIADITYTPCSGGTISLGSHVIPYTFQSFNYTGQYSLYFSAFNSTCSYEITCPTPTVTPTNTVSPTTTPTNTNTPTPSATPNIVTNNLQLYLQPSSYVGSGTVWDTTVGFGTTDATLSGSPTYNVLSGFTFNGTSSYGRIPSVNGVTNFTNTQQYTVEVWFNASSGQPSAAESDLLEKWNFNGESRYPYVFRFFEVSNSFIVSVFDGTGGGRPVTITGVTVNTWTQIVGVYDFVGGTLTVYRNGVSAGSTSLVGMGQVSNTSPVGIAHRINSITKGPEIMFKGTVSVVRMYNTSLTSSQVLQNFNADKTKYGL